MEISDKALSEGLKGFMEPLAAGQVEALWQLKEFLEKLEKNRLLMAAVLQPNLLAALWVLDAFILRELRYNFGQEGASEYGMPLDQEGWPYLKQICMSVANFIAHALASIEHQPARSTGLDAFRHIPRFLSPYWAMLQKINTLRQEDFEKIQWALF